MRRLRLTRTYIDVYCPLTISRHAPVPFSGPALLFLPFLWRHIETAVSGWMEWCIVSVVLVLYSFDNKVRIVMCDIGALAALI